MNNTTLTSKQESFIRELIRAYGTEQTDHTGQVWYSRGQLLSTANDLGMKYPPAWIVQDVSRKGPDRGTYYVAEATSLTSSSAVPSAVPSAVAPERSIGQMANDGMIIGTERVPVDMNDYALSLVSDTMVPAIMRDYVAWGHHKDLESILKSGINANVYVTGLSGNGKTTMIEQCCAKLKREMFRVNITAQTDEDDLLGGFRLVNGETKFVYGPVVEAMKRGAVLLLDEVDLGLAPIMCLQPVLEGKGVFLKKTGEWITPDDGFVVFATANTKGEGSDDGMFTHTNIQNEAFLDRFAFTYDQAYATKAVERKILTKKAEKYGTNDPGFLDNLVTWAEVTRKAFTEGAVEKVISTRRLEDAVKAFAMFGDRMKSVDLVLARFDESTREAFSNLYTKVDADVHMPADEERPWYDDLANWEDCERVVVDVSFTEKDTFKADYPTAQWDIAGKYWYIPKDDAINMMRDTNGLVGERWEKLLPRNPRKLSTGENILNIATNS